MLNFVFVLMRLSVALINYKFIFNKHIHDQMMSIYFNVLNNNLMFSFCINEHINHD